MFSTILYLKLFDWKLEGIVINSNKLQGEIFSKKRIFFLIVRDLKISKKWLLG